MNAAIAIDPIAAGKLEAIADEFERYPERWTQGAMARDRYGELVYYSEDVAVCWCQAGARQRDDIWVETQAAVVAAAEEMIVTDSITEDAGIKVNDHLGREATIKTLRQAARLLRGLPMLEDPDKVRLQWAVYTGTILLLGAALGWGLKAMGWL